MAAGLPVAPTGEVVELAAQGDGPALELVRDAGRTIGTVLAALVNFFNPHRIVMTGGVAQAGAPLLAGIREAVYRRSMPLAARALEITVSDAPDLSGRVGAALMAIEEFLDEDSVAGPRAHDTRPPVAPRRSAARPASAVLPRGEPASAWRPRVGPGVVPRRRDAAAPTPTGDGAWLRCGPEDRARACLDSVTRRERP